MTGFDDTLQVIGDIQSSASLEQVCGNLLVYTSRLGLDHVMAGIVPDEFAFSSRPAATILFAKWPRGWMDRYIQKNYVLDDPVVLQALIDTSPFSWTDAASRFAHSNSSGRVIGDATEFRLCDGFALPLSTLEGAMILVSLGGEGFAASPKERGALALVTAYAAGRALQIYGAAPRREPPRLTGREAECLRWAAVGKSEWEISQILGISEHTAERHLLNAKLRLGAANRVQAVAEAIRLGLIA